LGVLRRLTVNAEGGYHDTGRTPFETSCLWNGIMTMDDWLGVDTNHVPDHIQQMPATHASWTAEKEGRRPDPSRSLFEFAKT